MQVQRQCPVSTALPERSAASLGAEPQSTAQSMSGSIRSGRTAAPAWHQHQQLHREASCAGWMPHLQAADGRHEGVDVAASPAASAELQGLGSSARIPYPGSTHSMPAHPWSGLLAPAEPPLHTHFAHSNEADTHSSRLFHSGPPHPLMHTSACEAAEAGATRLGSCAADTHEPSRWQHIGTHSSDVGVPSCGVDTHAVVGPPTDASHWHRVATHSSDLGAHSAVGPPSGLPTGQPIGLGNGQQWAEAGRKEREKLSALLAATSPGSQGARARGRTLPRRCESNPRLSIPLWPSPSSLSPDDLPRARSSPGFRSCCPYVAGGDAAVPGSHPMQPHAETCCGGDLTHSSCRQAPTHAPTGPVDQPSARWSSNVANVSACFDHGQVPLGRDHALASGKPDESAEGVQQTSLQAHHLPPDSSAGLPELEQSTGRSQDGSHLEVDEEAAAAADMDLCCAPDTESRWRTCAHPHQKALDQHSSFSPPCNQEGLVQDNHPWIARMHEDAMVESPFAASAPQAGRQPSVTEPAARFQSFLGPGEASLEAWNVHPLAAARSPQAPTFLQVANPLQLPQPTQAPVHPQGGDQLQPTQLTSRCPSGHLLPPQAPTRQLLQEQLPMQLPQTTPAPTHMRRFVLGPLGRDQIACGIDHGSQAGPQQASGRPEVCRTHDDVAIVGGQRGDNSSGAPIQEHPLPKFGYGSLRDVVIAATPAASSVPHTAMKEPRQRGLSLLNGPPPAYRGHGMMEAVSEATRDMQADHSEPHLGGCQTVMRRGEPGNQHCHAGSRLGTAGGLPFLEISQSPGSSARSCWAPIKTSIDTSSVESRSQNGLHALLTLADRSEGLSALSQLPCCVFKYYHSFT